MLLVSLSLERRTHGIEDSLVDSWVDSFLPILIFPQTEGPKFSKGFPSIVGLTVVAVALTGECRFADYPLYLSYDADPAVLADVFHKRQLRQEEVHTASLGDA
jgi:hypothetical protein